jgi:hypothetical protein
LVCLLEASGERDAWDGGTVLMERQVKRKVKPADAISPGRVRHLETGKR